jgi:hypothetical protein
VNTWTVAAGAAAWLGVLTSISPCLLATNVAAISFIARKVVRPRYVIASGLFYTGGQAAAFVALAALLVSSLVSVPIASHWLQKYVFRLLGPVLVLVAIFLLELIELPPAKGRLKQWVEGRGESGGFWAAALLGIVFAMSFCPTTAALFFGSLIPLAIAERSPVFLPLMYAVGVALPVMTFSVIIAVAAGRVAVVFQRVSHVERWARRGTGLIVLAIGIYFTLAFTMRVL